MAKRYYWLKLPDDFFRQKPIKKLRKIAGGDTYTIIYLKMLLIAMKQDNRIYFDGVEENFFAELALELDEEEENVKVTTSFLMNQGLMELVDDTEYVMTQCEELTGSESSSAARVRKHRENKALQCNTDVTPLLREGNVETEKEIEKEKEKEIYKTSCPEQNSGLQPMVEIEPAAVAQPMVETEPVVQSGMMVEKKQTEPSLEVFIKFPLNNGTEFDVTRPYVSELQDLYPAVDVEQALRNMRGWLDSNPKNRKTAKGIKRFITGWLAREQDRSPRKNRQDSGPTAKNRFNNFPQRDYNWDQLEQQLLNN